MGIFTKVEDTEEFKDLLRVNKELNKELNDATKHQRKEDRETIRTLKSELAAKKDELKLEKAQHELDIKVLKDKVEVYEEIEDKVADLTKREILIEKREALYDAKNEAMDEFKDEVKKLREEQEEVANAKYKTGYADGLSDGIRKGTEYSAEDRKMLAQVAMLSAASHTPEAASTIAKEVAKNALPATTRTKN